MPVPSTQEIYKPLLEAFNVEAPRNFTINDFLKYVAEYLGEDINSMSSNEKNNFRQNVNDAKNFLRKKNLISNPSRITYMITDLGREVLKDNPEIISDDYLNTLTQKNSQDDLLSVPPVPAELSLEPEPPQEPELEQEISPEPQIEEESEHEIITEETTTEFANIEAALAKHNADLAAEVLSHAAAIPSDMFEILVIDLLSKMGYRTFQNARYTSDEAGNEFIQGVILDNDPSATPIYIHVQRLSPDKTVGRADMQDFIDALADKGGKGIFATTANFSEQALISANDERIMLIDGPKLASLMINHNFCVNTEKVFEVRAIDLESFREYE